MLINHASDEIFSDNWVDEDKTNCILKLALDENNKMHNNGQHCLVNCIYYILKEHDMLKMFKSPLTCGAREMNIIRKKLREIYKNLEGED